MMDGSPELQAPSLGCVHSAQHMRLPERIRMASDKKVWTNFVLNKISPKFMAPRKWSPWLTWCPVSLSTKGTLVPGKFDQAACFGGRVFLMSSKQTLAQFLERPLRFLTDHPTKLLRIGVLVLRRLTKEDDSTWLTYMASDCNLTVVDLEELCSVSLQIQCPWQKVTNACCAQWNNIQHHKNH